MTRGKKVKAMRVDRTAEREARRRKERQQTIFTMIVIFIVVAIGGVLIYFSAQEPSDLAESPSELPTDLASEASEPPDNRKVACGAEAPANADEEKQTFPKPEEVLDEGKDYSAVIKTSCGDINVDLYEEESPETVNSFVFLAQQGFFDGLEIFRNATSIGALQTGAGGNDASWDIGYQLKDELAKAQEDGYPVGAVAMANSGPNSGGSQFFFVYNEQFDKAFEKQRNYAVFGITDPAGVKVLEKIGKIPPATDDPSGEKPSQLVYMESVEITSK